MKTKKRALALLALAALWLVPALSIAEDASEVIASLQARYESVRSLKAAFTQTVAAKGMAPQTSEGTVFFMKPGRMRWEYKKPEKDLIVSDGKTMWLFQADLNQVIEKPVSSAASSMATDFLSGIGSIERGFVVLLSGVEGGEHILTLTPKEEQPGIKRLVLHVDRYAFTVNKTVLTDHYGNQTEVVFTNMQINPPIKDSIFKFKAPKGSAVVRP